MEPKIYKIILTSIIVSGIVYIISIFVLIFFEIDKSCKNESKSDYLQRVFIEETQKNIYYTDKFLEALDKNCSDSIEIYLDSGKMCNYRINKIYKEMYGKDKNKDDIIGDYK